MHPVNLSSGAKGNVFRVRFSIYGFQYTVFPSNFRYFFLKYEKHGWVKLLLIVGLVYAHLIELYSFKRHRNSMDIIYLHGNETIWKSHLLMKTVTEKVFKKTMSKKNLGNRGMYRNCEIYENCKILWKLLSFAFDLTKNPFLGFRSLATRA